jgi:predicted membrane protein
MLNTVFASQKVKRIFAVSLAMGLVLAAIFFFSPIAEAKTKTNEELQKAAEKACPSGAVGTEGGACRNGYRHGYRGDEGVLVACISRESEIEYGEKEKQACIDGHSKGSKQRLKDDPNSANSGGKLGSDGEYICGTYSDQGRNVRTKFDFGCLGTAHADNPGSFPASSKNISPIMDFAFAIIRFLSIGVGIAITIAMIAAGIQYSASEGSAEASTKAKKRIESAITGLVIYIFAFSVLQFLIPGGIFK